MRGYPDPKSVGHNAHTVPQQESPMIEKRRVLLGAFFLLAFSRSTG
jgi:hypothetical protein